MSAEQDNIRRVLQDNKQNYFVAMAFDRASQVIKWCIENDLTVLDVQVGQFHQPVIKVQDTPACNALEPHGYASVHHVKQGMVTKSAVLLDCIIEWEQRFHPSLHTIN